MRTVLRVALSMAFLAISFGRPFFAQAAPTPAAVAPENAVVAVRNGRMTLKTQAAPLLSLLEEIAGVADVQIICFSKIPADQLVTADLSGWPVEKTLVSLLNGLNHMVIYAPGDAKRGVVLRGGALSAGSVPGVPRALTVAAKAPGGTTAAEGEGPEQATGGLRIEGRKYSTNAVAAAPSSGAAAGRSKNTASAAQASFDSGAGRQPQRDLTQVIDIFVAKYKKPVSAGEEPRAASARVSAKIAREEFVKRQIDILTKRIESGYSDRQFKYWSKIKDPKFIQDDRALLNIYNQELTTLRNIPN